MKNSAGSVSDGLEKVWIARGGTTISCPSSASTSPSGVVNRIVPGRRPTPLLPFASPAQSSWERNKHSSWKRCQCIGGPDAAGGSSSVMHPIRLSVLLPSSKM
ncbi:hypothetical protein ColKHC_05301 [Colletotrichum higginsianum]|nr:hypothetical protein ColKHC_05301 [Colletotrichum higginsianum]